MSDTPLTDACAEKASAVWELCRRLERENVALRKERDVYAELAAGKCVIQKVIDELGPHTLMPKATVDALREDSLRLDFVWHNYNEVWRRWDGESDFRAAIDKARKT